VREIGKAIEEYRQKAHVSDRDLQFEVLPHEGFCITKTALPRVVLECRPDYDAHTACCNLTHVFDQESEPVERLFNLTFSIDAGGNVALMHGNRILRQVDEAVEALLKPVLFPLWADAPGS
jgi:hypothetical protein